jgi:hypothetical protein
MKRITRIPALDFFPSAGHYLPKLPTVLVIVRK